MIGGRVAVVAASAAVIAGLAACGGRSAATGPRGPAVPVPGSVRVGDCTDPGEGGVFGARPDLSRADRDLDGDGTDEVVVADRTMCTPEGNCHWNLYRIEGDCHRYLGTISAVGIQRLPPRGEGGFYGLRALWRLTGDGRLLLQEYRFQRGGYRLVEALLCRQSEDDRLLCQDEGR